MSDPKHRVNSGAGDGNRTHVRSLGSFYTAIVRRPLISSAAIIPQLIRCANTLVTNLANRLVRAGFRGAGTPACVVFAVRTPPGVAVRPVLVARLAAGGYIEIPDFMIHNGEDLYAG